MDEFERLRGLGYVARESLYGRRLGGLDAVIERSNQEKRGDCIVRTPMTRIPWRPDVCCPRGRHNPDECTSALFMTDATTAEIAGISLVCSATGSARGHHGLHQ